MELTEQIESLNKQLVNLFGIDSLTGRAMWRIVWSEDQREKRLTEFTPEGLQMLFPQVMELKKYPYIKEKYVLERLVLVPVVHERELPVSKLSYEPIFQFCDAETGEYRPPTIGASKFIIDTLLAAEGKESLGPKYKDAETGTFEERKEQIKQLEEELFGDESSLKLKTVTGEAVAYTGEPKIQSGVK